jgi:hypothetical protein
MSERDSDSILFQVIDISTVNETAMRLVDINTEKLTFGPMNGQEKCGSFKHDDRI